MEKMLEVKNLVVDYGIIRAIKGIDLEVERGSIVAILGANGAGKTTTIRTINGLVKAEEGKILLNGEEVTNLEPNRLANKGISQSPEGRMILNGLTVEENLSVGGYTLRTEVVNGKKLSAKTSKKQMLKEVYDLFPVLKERRKQQASTLSGGEQQMLSIGRALMGKPKLLLLDEPSLGLAPLIVKDIFEKIKQIRALGTTILIVEQNAYQTLKIADYVYVLELGKVKTQGTADKLLEDDQLVKAYLGG
ncbi:MAG TPA: ABC transporter ATP-binding protein [Candidatus Izemoplasmatales bacterium]|nr:ABC transporter ATP-binding protein [Candidatus Izemoplasmatales bacterium]